MNVDQYPVSKPMNGKQAGHFLQNGAINKVFQELCAFSLSDHGRMDGWNHTAIKLHTCGSCIKKFNYLTHAGSIGGHIRVLEKSLSAMVYR